MPLYDYAPTSGSCERCRGRFEVEQRMTDAKLTHCPECKEPVERLIGAAAINAGKVSVSDKRVGELGFTKYVKTGDGSYERAAGSGGPKTFGVKK
jgi:putative FmdB family regulatory protein